MTEYRRSLSYPTYLVGDDGSIIGRGGIVRKAYKTPRGYWHIAVSFLGVRKNPPVHFIVCEAFHGPRPEGMEVAHEDGNKDNNSAANLSWKTQIDNDKDKDRHGTRPRGSHNGVASLTERSVLDIRRIYAQGGVSHLKLAEQYGVSEATIQRIIAGTYWKHVEGDRVRSWMQLTPEMIKAIRCDRDAGMMLHQIADKYGVSKSNVHRVVRCEIWSHV